MLDEGAETESPLDDYSLGRIFERAELSERSVQHYLRVIESGIGGTARRRSLRQLASHYKRRGEFEEALGLWKHLTAEDGPESIQACEEIAMVHEHRDKDFSKALEICDQALERIEHDYHLPLRFRERSQEAFQHRRRRLERKLQKQSKNKLRSQE
jgi:tetratricopeptide (TPR) repeat protein